MKWKRAFRLLGWGCAISFILIGIFGPRDEKNLWFLLIWVASLVGIFVSVVGEWIMSHKITQRSEPL